MARLTVSITPVTWDNGPVDTGFPAAGEGATCPSDVGYYDE